jgi:hypothetical protein
MSRATVVGIYFKGENLTCSRLGVGVAAWSHCRVPDDDVAYKGNEESMPSRL